MAMKFSRGQHGFDDGYRDLPFFGQRRGGWAVKFCWKAMLPLMVLNGNGNLLVDLGGS